MLGYCTNVHSGHTFHDILHNIKTFCKPICAAAAKPSGIGLWLSAQALQEIKVGELKDTLEESCVEVFTMNAFPYSNFHASVVKQDVYRPTWCMEERLEYTIASARLLASITNETEAGISTLPLGWDQDSFSNYDAATMLRRCAIQLEEIEQDTGICIHIDIETEPGCRLQRASELSSFINEFFPDDEKIRKYIRVCHDTCHSAVMQEDISECIDYYEEAGLSIGKVQLSSALELHINEHSTKQEYDSLFAMHEQRYLHQTSVLNHGKYVLYEDIPFIPKVMSEGLWRMHYHVPIHLKKFGTFGTTQIDLIDCINRLKEYGVKHWEVETYTWDVMPTITKTNDLIDSISKELQWAAKQINT